MPSSNRSTHSDKLTYWQRSPMRLDAPESADPIALGGAKEELPNLAQLLVEGAGRQIAVAYSTRAPMLRPVPHLRDDRAVAKRLRSSRTTFLHSCASECGCWRDCPCRSAYPESTRPCYLYES